MAWNTDYFLIVDTETTQDNLVADFGAVVVNKKGEILTECKVLTFGIYNNEAMHPLFHMGENDQINLWAKANLKNRYANYNRMLESGMRMLAGVSAINRWLEKVKQTYNPYLTAYNLPFDLGKCKNTGIDLTIFGAKNFCLWGASYDRWAFTKPYKNFALMLHAFNNVTDLGNATYKTNAETMARFILNSPELEDEPHTAYEDVVFYELPILLKLVNSTAKNKWSEPSGYNWRQVQIKDHFKAI